MLWPETKASSLGNSALDSLCFRVGKLDHGGRCLHHAPRLCWPWQVSSHSTNMFEHLSRVSHDSRCYE